MTPEQLDARESSKAYAAAQLRMLFRSSEVSDVYRALADLRDQHASNVFSAACLVLLSELLETLPQSPHDSTVYALEYLLESKTVVGRDALIGFCRVTGLDVVTHTGDEGRIQ